MKWESVTTQDQIIIKLSSTKIMLSFLMSSKSEENSDISKLKAENLRKEFAFCGPEYGKMALCVNRHFVKDVVWFYYPAFIGKGAFGP